MKRAQQELADAEDWENYDTPRYLTAKWAIEDLIRKACQLCQQRRHHGLTSDIIAHRNDGKRVAEGRVRSRYMNLRQQWKIS